MSNLVVFEIGTEEIPAEALVRATAQLKNLVAAALGEARIEFGEVETMSTPRRMITMIHDIADETTPLISRQKGPACDIAFDKDGNPTKAAIGFARGRNLEVKDLQRGHEGGKEYVYAIVRQNARKTRSILGDILAGIIPQLSWPRSQRWGSREETFSRPVRWLLALYNDRVLPMSFAGLEAGRTTRGHRLLANREFEVAGAASYLGVLAEAFVVPSADERARIIREQIAAYEKESGLTARTPEHTFTEVVNLVEYPTVLMGHFDEEYLKVPPEIITDAMLSNQRYFPMYSQDGALSCAFLLVSNGSPEKSATIIDGNERVVRPRLDDAKFFYDEDRKRPLESYVADLDRVVFQESLGTLRDKTRRIERIAIAIDKHSGCKPDESYDAERAAHLCKADLVTSAVIEFTSQQGVMGGYYALSSGETQGVATAIAEHYRPRHAGDELPSTYAGCVVAIADKLDTICGIFAADQAPTGSKDPFAVRRAAIGIITILLSGMNVSLSRSIEVAIANYEGTLEFDKAAITAAVRDFFRTRLAVMAREQGIDADTVDAVLAVDVIEPVEVMSRCEALDAARKGSPELFDNLATAYARAANLCDRELGTRIDESLLTSADAALLEAVKVAETDVSKALAHLDFSAAISALSELRAPIDRFFEDVMVMDDDPAKRDNNLRLLNRFVAVFGNVADIGKLQAK